MQQSGRALPHDCQYPRPGAVVLVLACAVLLAGGCGGKTPQEKAAEREREREQMGDGDAGDGDAGDGDDGDGDDGDGDDGDDDDAGVGFIRDPESACAQLTLHTRDCGLLEPDEERPCIDPWDSFTACLSMCSLETSCDDMALWICDQVPLTQLESISDCVAGCQDAAYQCSDGVVVPGEWVCDSERDCRDGADEADCEDGFDNAFTCDDGDLVPEFVRCNANPDCADGSDEDDCGDRLFTCDEGVRTIRAAYRCDGERDCPDGSDERGCPPIAEFACP